MITPVTGKADLLTMPHQGGEPEDVAAKRPTTAGTQPGSNHGPSEPIDRATLDQAVAKVSDVLRSADTHLRIEIDDATKQVVVKVLKGESEEVIRQFPPKEVLELAKFFSGSKGVLLREQA